MILSKTLVHYLNDDFACRDLFELVLELLKNVPDMVFNFYSEWVCPVSRRLPTPGSFAGFADILSHLVKANGGEKFGWHVQEVLLCHLWFDCAASCGRLSRHSSPQRRQLQPRGTAGHALTILAKIFIYCGTFVCSLSLLSCGPFLLTRENVVFLSLCLGIHRPCESFSRSEGGRAVWRGTLDCNLLLVCISVKHVNWGDTEPFSNDAFCFVRFEIDTAKG
jgi:hypothetical protein